ncbi:UDP-glycosyltransferase 72B2 [Hibiscus syriacus]|uniref:UDP-glycosyltransferase 72B2 n=1 Tax=Hibiscus syriacus TaxID=106335 RepID=A0A6A2XKQ4_HIBSY|nr:UDP-glycosyltransferase 72B2 [Hibiscus syriacus]
MGHLIPLVQFAKRLVHQHSINVTFIIPLRLQWLLHRAKRYRLAQGIMVNSFMDLEGVPIKALQESKPPIYPVGPLVNADSSREPDGSGCMKWLDVQEVDSVLYVSFGSGGTLSMNQLNELAMGLEMSGQRFLWVIRSPNDSVAIATFFRNESQNDPFEFLPKGFIERTKDRGLLVPSGHHRLKC